MNTFSVILGVCTLWLFSNSVRASYDQEKCLVKGHGLVPVHKNYSPALAVCCDFQLIEVDNALDHRCCHGENRGKVYNYKRKLCCGGEVLDNPDLAIDCCNGAAYNVSNKICCEDKLYDKPPNTNLQCCGEGTYDADKKTCCDGLSFDIADGQCCGGVAHSWMDSLCCQNTLHMVDSTSWSTDCCGKDLYDQQKDLCCMGPETDVPAPIPPGMENPQCCQQPNDSFVVIDSEKQLCCWSGPQIKLSPTSECCGEGHVDGITEICCDDKLVSTKGGKTQCCGSAAIDPNSATCCDGTVNEGIARGQCCGDKAYLSNTQTCCDGELLDEPTHPDKRCCGRAVYTFSNQLCCNDNILDKTYQDEACCGVGTYNPVSQTCCAVVKGDVPSVHGDCCLDKENDSMQVFDKRKHVCCEGKLGKAGYSCCGKNAYDPSDNIQCIDFSAGTLKGGSRCGRDTYNPIDQICCSGLVNQKIHKNSGCCNGQVIDLDSHKCCGGFVSNLPHAVSLCCGVEAYNPKTHKCFLRKFVKPIPKHIDVAKPVQPTGHDVRTGTRSQGSGAVSGLSGLLGTVLCEGKVYRTHGKQVKCCGDKMYVPSENTHVCCRGHLHVNCQGRSMCCGNKPHNPAIETCCGEEVISSANMSCCGTEIYNKEKKICCNGSLIDAETHLCCGNAVYKADSHSCCNGLPYNLKTGRCCSGVVQEKRNPESRCCANRPYNYMTHKCIRDKILRGRKRQIARYLGTICTSPVVITGTVEEVGDKMLITPVKILRALDTVPNKLPLETSRSYIMDTPYLFVGHISENGMFVVRNGIKRKAKKKVISRVIRFLENECS